MAPLRVLEIFHSLQGEGYWSGVPMTFVRLAGCNAAELGLGCTAWCDTPAGWALDEGEDREIGEVLSAVTLPRLCLTGGEPLLQTGGVAELIGEAEQRGIRVHVETNGTVDPLPILELARDYATARPGATPRPFPEFGWAAVSPKPPDYAVAPGWAGLVDELKLVADEHLDAATAERLAAANLGAFVCIQPLYAQGPAPPDCGSGRGPDGAGAAPQRTSSERAVELVMRHPEWRLSLQLHKHLGIR
ncbi:MAG: hypothetical protein A2133_12705 [Actinobacteria bacterium RBG_16_64_13]|nr:MAG: hypothetical protein A2133_12705 [Actinobacteria bacterium RBG_16_64_13]